MWPGPVKKFPAFYETRRFITVFIEAHHRPLSWARRIQPTHPCPITARSILIVFSILHPVIPSGLFPSGFDIKSLYAILLLAVRATFPSHLILLELVILVVCAEEYGF